MATTQIQTNPAAGYDALVKAYGDGILNVNERQFNADNVKKLQIDQRRAIASDPNLSDCQKAAKQLEVNQQWEKVWKERYDKGDERSYTFLQQTKAFIASIANNKQLNQCKVP